METVSLSDPDGIALKTKLLEMNTFTENDFKQNISSIKSIIKQDMLAKQKVEEGKKLSFKNQKEKIKYLNERFEEI